MRFLLPLALCLGILSAQTKPAATLDKPKIEAYIRHLLAISPEVQISVSDPKPSPLPDLKQVEVHLSLGNNYKDETYYVSNDGKKIVSGSIYDLNSSPFQADLDKLKTADAPSFGPASAPITMVLFSDFECPNCKEEAKVIRENVPAKFAKEVRVYFKDFPLEAIHPWAKTAAIDGRCVFHQSPAAFWKFHDWMYEHQPEITGENLKDKVMEWAKTGDVDTLQLGRCIENKSTEAEVDKEIAEGRALKVEATPTTFLNGRRLVGNYPWQNLEQIITSELKYQQTPHADDKCCEISIPSPIKK